MTEREAIIAAYQQAAKQNVRGALATVVRVEGSAYRRPGARMFVTENKERTGVLSGGCLEGDVAERALKVIETGSPVVVTYDTTSDDDIVWGLGIGCRGVVQILIEPASDFRCAELVQLLEDCRKTSQRGALATVIRCEGNPEIDVGARALLYTNGASRSEAGFYRMFCGPEIVKDLRNAVRNGVSEVRRYQTERGIVEVFVEVIEPQLPLVIIGAGDDALPLVSLAKTLGWHTTVVDTRSRPAIVARFAEADEIVLCRAEEVCDRVRLTDRTAVVLMTHNYLSDLELLKTLLNTPLRYLGCLGPRHRTEQLLLEIADEIAFLKQLYAPAGLDIGADTPIEVAFSIVSEIKAVVTGREGGLLRLRKGPIHTTAPRAAVRTFESLKMQCEVAVA
ncbi:MAG TPA: XdhC family protein [Pyrinomonadaceae bacterium]|nr:XdhC family protein [Pyrinomonadaceae bacterium]